MGPGVGERSPSMAGALQEWSKKPGGAIPSGREAGSDILGSPSLLGQSRGLRELWWSQTSQRTPVRTHNGGGVGGSEAQYQKTLVPQAPITANTSNSCHLLNTYYVPQTVLNLLLILTTTICGGSRQGNRGTGSPRLRLSPRPASHPPGGDPTLHVGGRLQTLLISAQGLAPRSS